MKKMMLVAIMVSSLVILCSCGKNEKKSLDACTVNMKQIGLATRMYSCANKEKLPSRNGVEGLEMLRSGKFLEEPEKYVCPGSKTVPAKPGARLTESNVDYVYIGGYSESASPDTVILYDKEGNHSNKYVNFWYIDNHVETLAGEAGIKKRDSLNKK